MARVLYHVTASLDGFIAGPDDDMTWLRGLIGGPNPAVDELMPQIGAVLIGGHTFRPASAAEGRPYGGAFAGPTYVLTRSDPAPPPADGFIFLSGEVRDAVATASAAAGDGYVVLLGAMTARLCLEADLLDEVLVHVAPVLLGEGVRLFERTGAPPVPLEWVERSESAGVTNLWLRVPH